MKHPELNFIGLFSLVALTSLLSFSSFLALMGERSWSGIPMLGVILIISIIGMHLQSLQQDGYGLWRVIKMCYSGKMHDSLKESKLTLFDGSVCFIIISMMTAYSIYFSIMN